MECLNLRPIIQVGPENPYVNFEANLYPFWCTFVLYSLLMFVLDFNLGPIFQEGPEVSNWLLS